MDEPVTYDVYLEIGQDGRCTARILDLPGCFASGASEEHALVALNAIIPRYYSWLKQHDEYTPDVRGPWRLAPRETFRTFMSGNYEVGAFFTPDAVPVDDEELDWGLALLGWAYEDLLAMIRALPSALLDAAPASGGWTVRQTAEHVAGAQLWYLTRLDAQPKRPAFSQPGTDPATQLQHASATAISALRAASDEQRTAVLEHHGERWSMHKVVRQSVQHILDHTGQIQRTVSASGFAR